MRGTGLYVLCLFFGACVEVPSVPIVGDLPVDGGSVADGGSTTADAGPAPIDAAPPEVRITTPTDGATLGADVSTVLVEGTASDDVSIATVRLAVGANAPVQAATTDFYRTWRVMISMPAGPQRLRAIVTDSAGKTAEAAITITRAPARTDAAPPSLAILEPAAGARSTRVETLVTGTADDDTGIAKVELRVDGTSAFVPVETGDNFAHWLALLQPRAVVFIGKWAAERGGPVVEAAGIPYKFMNRQRSLSSVERAENRNSVVNFVRAKSS